jgi:hypothetical protein
MMLARQSSSSSPLTFATAAVQLSQDCAKRKKHEHNSRIVFAFCDLRLKKVVAFVSDERMEAGKLELESKESEDIEQ